MTAKPAAPETRIRTHERHFYQTNRAFGRLGMRIFPPKLMAGPHWHGHIEINLLTGGAMTYQLDHDTIEVRDGQPVIFWAGIPHQLIALTPTGDAPMKLANIYVPADTFLMMPHIAPLQVALLGGAMVELAANAIDQAQMAHWYEDYRSNEVERHEVLKMELNAILRRTLLRGPTFLRRPVSSGPAEKSLSSSHVNHVVVMVRYILENLSQPIQNADVTRATGLHENYALSLFSKVMRVSMKRFIIQMRLVRARAGLIESAEPITTVAIDAGFNSISQFYAHFSKNYGMSPNELRRTFAATKLG